MTTHTHADLIARVRRSQPILGNMRAVLEEDLLALADALEATNADHADLIAEAKRALTEIRNLRTSDIDTTGMDHDGAMLMCLGRARTIAILGLRRIELLEADALHSSEGKATEGEKPAYSMTVANDETTDNNASAADTSWPYGPRQKPAHLKSVDNRITDLLAQPSEGEGPGATPQLQGFGGDLDKGRRQFLRELDRLRSGPVDALGPAISYLLDEIETVLSRHPVSREAVARVIAPLSGTVSDRAVNDAIDGILALLQPLAGREGDCGCFQCTKVRTLNDPNAPVMVPGTRMYIALSRMFPVLWRKRQKGGR
jgi:hypothetical protein